MASPIGRWQPAVLAVASLLALPGGVAAQPASGGPDALKKALLGHDLPLAVGRGAVGDGRRRADTVGAFDLTEVGIELRFDDGLELPATVRFDVTFEARQRIAEGFTLLAIAYTPVAVRELGGAEMDFVHTPQAGELAIFVPRPISAGATRTFVIEAELDIGCDEPPGCSNIAFLHLVDALWYPMSYEYPSDDRFLVRLELDSPQPLIPTGTGIRLGPQQVRDGRVRASFVTERPTILPAFSVGPYNARQAGIVEAFAPAGDVAPGAPQAMLDIGVDAVATYSRLFGPFPFNRLGMAAIDAAAGAGLGPQANILLPDVFWQLPPEDSDFAALVREVTTHEIGHQYFFNLLGVVDNGEAWMSEAFAEYAATRMSEVVTGTRDHARRNYWAYVHGVAPGEDRPLWGEGVSASPRYFELVYQKGSAALHALRYRVGSDRWDAAFRGWIADFAGQLVTTAEFEDYLTDALDLDPASFFDQFIYGAGVADLRVRTTRGRTEQAPVTVEIEQVPGRFGPFSGPIPLRLHQADGGARDVIVELGDGPYAVSLDGAQWIEVDPDLTLFRRVRADPAGDVNLDGVVDGMDLLDVHARVGLRQVTDGPLGSETEPDWAERFDIDDDGVVDTDDVDRLLEQFGAGW